MIEVGVSLSSGHSQLGLYFAVSSSPTHIHTQYCVNCDVLFSETVIFIVCGVIFCIYTERVGQRISCVFLTFVCGVLITIFYTTWKLPTEIRVMLKWPTAKILNYVFCFRRFYTLLCQCMSKNDVTLKRYLNFNLRLFVSELKYFIIFYLFEFPKKWLHYLNHSPHVILYPCILIPDTYVCIITKIIFFLHFLNRVCINYNKL